MVQTIVLKNIVKKYLLRHEKPTLVEQILGFSQKNEFIALNNLSLSINKGEKVGIIGLNGSGKTTLLKIIAGIATPNSGSVHVKGRVVSLIDLNAGFHPELSGQENIYLSGLLLGMSRKEVQQKMKMIISFAEIGEFIDAPFYTYSEGMKLRLGFSIAIFSEPDILLMDEGGVMVGDAYFQKKMMKKIKVLFRQKKTIIFVTQWRDFVEQHCNRIIVLKKGKIIDDRYDNFARAYNKL